ncbi:S-adenosylmethionine mitochondrial carrier protein [Dioscorea cayenensis subsp. rotundata]|uniref:S-adenosylmethionine mitochondrial carrier protein n=1 Tax=Dioscorea cayennensis subsp. rotundata TaxID=55577 RepID=A0AB40C7T7_DIOCR|nr:S-adenosylmethionine mitochondrial carrier protein [Dioscorea cayenensis subsp. rotundata]
MASIAGDPFKSFVEDSIRAFKHAIVDLQSNFGRAAKDLESHWPNPRNGARFLQPFSNQDEIVASTASLVRFDRLEGLVDGIRWREADADCFLSQNEGRFIFESVNAEDGDATIEEFNIAMKNLMISSSARGVGVQYEADSSVANPPPAKEASNSVMKSALAGALACAFSTAVMHPVDTLKTCVQASTASFPELLSNIPQIGLHGLYRGSIPAIFGQFYSHGLRTGLFEASRLILGCVAPSLPELQVYSLSSFCGTMLGTASRIPCEVLKQRLQAGIFNNVGEAVVGTLRQDGIKGFFRGTKATLMREVPFYVAGTRLYEEAKKVTRNLLGRELEPWEAMLVGAVSGGLTAVGTTPIDVMKTRMMIAPQGLSPSMSSIAITIFQQEGPLALFKGAVPRFFWVAPLGAINFAGFELIRKAMDTIEQKTVRL